MSVLSQILDEQGNFKEKNFSDLRQSLGIDETSGQIIAEEQGGRGPHAIADLPTFMHSFVRPGLKFTKF